MTYIIHRVTSPSEAEQAAKIVDESLKHDFPYKEKTILAYRKNVFNSKYFPDFLKEKENTILGAFKDKNLIGFIGLHNEYGGVIYIDWLVVEKEYRSEGIGSWLLEEAEKWALQNKFHCLYLYTETEANVDFYKKRGFKYIGAHDKFWFGEKEHILSKILREKPFEEIFKV